MKSEFSRVWGESIFCEFTIIAVEPKVAASVKGRRVNYRLKFILSLAGIVGLLMVLAFLVVVVCIRIAYGFHPITGAHP